MTDTCTIADPSHKSAGGGQQWVTRAGTVKCGVSSLSQALQSGQITFVPDMASNVVTRVFALPHNTAIEQGARIWWSGEASLNHYYEVRSVELPGSYAMQVSAIAVRTRSAS